MRGSDTQNRKSELTLASALQNEKNFLYLSSPALVKTRLIESLH
jgi:hypothetical protein